jgi:indolepyruvate ferredoxin oxidoreductase beta subunit
MNKFSRRHWLLPATEEAVKLGSPILANIILIGALAGTNVLPVGREGFYQQIASTMPHDKAEMNLRAFDIGWQMTS